MNAAAIEDWMASRVAVLLGIPEAEVDRTLPFPSLGLDSLTMFTLTGEIAELLKRDLAAQLAWEYRTIRDLAGHLADSASAADEAPIVPVPRDHPLALSFSQERIWRAANKQGDGNKIMEQWIFEGDLDIPALKRSLTEIVLRHEIMRTTYTTLEGRPIQVIHPPTPVVFPVIDLSRETDPVEKAAQLVREEGLARVNLEQGPLFRVVVMRLSDVEHRVVFSLHHLLYDAVSLEIFYEELSALYTAFSNGVPSPLENMPVQVADYAAWQRNRFRKDGETYQKRMAWWKDYWSEPMPGALALPFRWKEKPAVVPGLDKSGLAWEVPPALLERLKELCRKEGATYYTVFFTAFEAVLHRLTGQEEIVIASYMSDRNRKDVNRSMGFFVNLVAFRARVAGQQSFIEALRQAKTMIQESSPSMELPFDELAAELLKENRPTPNVQVIFIVVTDAEHSLQLPRLKTSRWRLRSYGQMPWGLSMHVFERADGRVRVRLSFDTTLYDPAGVERMMRQYEEVLRTMVADPESLIGVPVPGPQECELSAIPQK